MDKSAIVFVVNGNSYQLRADDNTAFQQMKPADRQDLIALLERVKLWDRQSSAKVQNALDQSRPRGSIEVASLSTGDEIPASKFDGGNIGSSDRGENRASLEPGRALSAGEVDDLMARLVLEENRQKKQPLTKKSLYKFIVITAVVVIVALLIFS